MFVYTESVRDISLDSSLCSPRVKKVTAQKVNTIKNEACNNTVRTGSTALRMFDKAARPNQKKAAKNVLERRERERGEEPERGESQTIEEREREERE